MAKTYQRTKLQEVTIRGYKSIAYDRPVTLKLGDVSILLGANGAGKSNIISFFRMLSYMMSKSFGRYVEISGTSHALLHYGIKRTPVMSGELKFADSNSMDVYGFSLANATPDRLIITEERIVDYVRDVVPQFQDFYLEPVGGIISLRWIDNSATDYRFNAYQFSDGSIRFIALAALLLQPAQTMPNVIILDEPELGLHPYAISQLAEMIKDASIHAQVIIATQSKDLVDHFDIGDISVVEMNKETQATSVTHLDAKEYHLWLQNYTVSELWDKNIIGGRPV